MNVSHYGLFQDLLAEKFYKILGGAAILLKTTSSHEMSNFSPRVWESWVHHYASGLAPGYDVAVDIVAASQFIQWSLCLSPAVG